MRARLPLILIGITVHSALKFAQSSHLTEDQSNFQNLFDSIAKNDETKNEAYRNVIRRDLKEERQAFDAIKEELSTAKVGNIHMRRNSNQKSNSIRDNTMQIKREIGVQGRRNDELNKMTSRLPVAGDNFETCVQNNKIIVDKTPYIKKLLTETGLLFISRPPGFGKSFFINMLECFFLNKKNLFKNTALYNETIPTYPWKAYPLIKINFAEYAGLSPKNFELKLIEKLWQIRNEHNVEPQNFTSVSAADEVEYLVEELSKRGQAAIILIDEYDSPYMHSVLAQDGNAERISSTVSNFHAGIKSVAEKFKFGFITGRDRLHLKSGMLLPEPENIISDISWDTEYHDLIGFTKSEIDHYYTDVLHQSIETKRRISSKTEIDRLSHELLDNLTSWYNNYHLFITANETNRLYSPLSVVEFLTELPSKLIRTNRTKTTLNSHLMIAAMKQYPAEMILLIANGYQDSCVQTFSVLSQPLSTRNLLSGEDFVEVLKLLLQEGFITIEKHRYYEDNGLLQLACKNEEIRVSLWKSLKHTLLPGKDKMLKLLTQRDFVSFFFQMENCVTRTYNPLMAHQYILFPFCLSNGNWNNMIKAVRTNCQRAWYGRSEWEDYVLVNSGYVFHFMYKINSTYLRDESNMSKIEWCKDRYRKKYHRNERKLILFCITILFKSHEMRAQPEVTAWFPRSVTKSSTLPSILNWSVRGFAENGSIIGEHDCPTAREKLEFEPKEENAPKNTL